MGTMVTSLSVTMFPESLLPAMRVPKQLAWSPTESCLAHLVGRRSTTLPVCPISRQIRACCICTTKCLECRDSQPGRLSRVMSPRPSGLSALGMVALRKALSPTALVPTLAAPVFVLASLSGWGEDFLSSNTEILANLFILAGVWLLVAEDFSHQPLRLFLGGASLGTACLYRYQSGASLLAYATTILLRHRQFDRKITRLLFIGGGVALPGVILVGYYAWLGALADLRLMLALQVHYARGVENFHWLRFLGRVLIAVSGLWPTILLASCQAVAILRTPAAASRSDIFQLLFAAWSAATFIVGGRFFPHYFVAAIPALALLATAQLEALEATSQPRLPWFKAHAFAILVMVAAVFTAINGTYYWTKEDARPSGEVVAFVEANSRPSDEVLLWAWRPQLLLETGRTFATRLLVNSPLIGQLQPMREPDRPATRCSGLEGLWTIFLRDFASAPPRLIIDDPPGRSEWSLDRYPQLASLLANYQSCRTIDDLCIYLRKE